MLKDKVVVITGASSGIGAEMAKLFAQKGATLILFARSMDKLQQLSSKIAGKHEFFSLDVTDSEQVFSRMNQVIQKYAKIDIFINNAGFGIFDSVMDAKLEDIEEMLDVNYLGMVRCVKAVLPTMIKQKSGHIINIASVAGKIATAKAAAYSASKFAVIGFSNGLRQEVASFGITVSTVNPGPIDTPFFDRADPSGNYVKNVEWMMLKPEKVALEVYDVILHKKIDKTIPRIAQIGVKLFHLFPNTFQRMMEKYLNQK
ncbi:SDR family NAD(P)-dependent oxidoreductase [Tepidibacillus fermentans]|uniref:Short-subunit dehydrogenase n=1 Tax=Tepidibacillus fermentans TaxID=1281767 RepID=A0A4R3KK91_9BACI|nr:SDR family oxidoreductase [Tepidibacillus fermentans]TCS84213.1 hypothetical protein EDD72_102257 [Tepidibacillus fermentans]